MNVGRDVPLVLVADDNPVNQIVAVRALERSGCVAEVANDGKQALDALAKHDYDAVLMDCEMPEIDGYEATRQLRHREVATDVHVPVIALTAQAIAGNRERCLAAGMDDYLTKPLRYNELVDALRRWVPALFTRCDEPAAPSDG